MIEGATSVGQLCQPGSGTAAPVEEMVLQNEHPSSALKNNPEQVQSLFEIRCLSTLRASRARAGAGPWG